MTGAILAGGHSRRMQGLDKTRLEREGRRVLERQVELLRGLCGDVLLLAREEQAPELEALNLAPVLADLFPGTGPLGGLYTALEDTEDEILLLACDMPFVEANLLQRLIDGLKAQPKLFALLPRSPDRQTGAAPWQAEPLCAVWSRLCRRPAYMALEAQELSLTRFAESLRAAYLDLTPDEARQMYNVNTRSELQDERLRLPDPPGTPV